MLGVNNYELIVASEYIQSDIRESETNKIKHRRSLLSNHCVMRKLKQKKIKWFA